MRVTLKKSGRLPVILTLCVILCKIFSVNSSGAYMNAYRGVLRNRFDSSSSSSLSSASPLLNGTSTKISNAGGLKETDELFSRCNGIDIRELTIPQVQHYFRTNQLTSLDLTNCYLQRIHHMNPYLNAIIQVNPDAIKQAFQADMERGKKIKTRSALLGIPILLKDNIGTKDLLETTAGSLAFLGVRPKRDAVAVQALRKAGVVILGKTNLSEFAGFRGTNIPNGWSTRGGQTRNAYNLSADPSGSSSGSGVAVAANLAMVALGTETDGSLLAPASVSALCVLKPTLGTPSTKGVIPISHTQDNVGPMARTTMDLAILWDALLENQGQTFGCGLSFTECLYRENYNKTLRVGVLRHPFWNGSIINSTDLHYELPYLENIVQSMRSSSQFQILDPVSSTPGLIEKMSGAKELVVLSHDMKNDINNYLANDVTYQFLPPNQKLTLKDIIKFNQDHPNQFGYNQDLLTLSELTDGLLNKTYLASKENNRRAGIELLDSLLVKYSLDAVMVPTEPRIDGVYDVTLKDSPIMGFSVAAMAGYPSINVPAGIGLNGVPFGMTFIGLPHTEARLLQVAHALERLTPRRQPPLFLV